MSKTKFLATGTSFLIALLAGNVYACGESLFRVGKGINFRDYTAPLPGSILVVANTKSEMAMVERLAAAGHDLHVVSDPTEIGDEMENHQIDIVLAYFSQRDEVESQMSGAIGKATYIPVTIDGTQEVMIAQELYAQSLLNDDSVKQFLKTIHRTLKAQG
jgi:hypothetical protein